MRCFESIEKVKWQYTMASNTMCRFQIKMQRSVFFAWYLSQLSFVWNRYSNRMPLPNTIVPFCCNFKSSKFSLQLYFYCNHFDSLFPPFNSVHFLHVCAHNYPFFSADDVSMADFFSRHFKMHICSGNSTLVIWLHLERFFFYIVSVFFSFSRNVSFPYTIQTREKKREENCTQAQAHKKYHAQNKRTNDT